MEGYEKTAPFEAEKVRDKLVEMIREHTARCGITRAVLAGMTVPSAASISAAWQASMK